MSRTNKQKRRHARRQWNVSAAEHARRQHNREVAAALERQRVGHPAALPDWVRWQP